MPTFPAGRRAKFVVLLAALVVAGGIGGTFAGKFEKAQKNETPSSRPGDPESVQALDAVKRFPGGETAAAVTVVRQAEGKLDLARVKALVDDLNRRRPRDTLESQGPIPSKDGRAALLITPVQATADSGDSQRFLDTVDDIRNRAHALRGDGREVEVTGAAGFGADAVKVFSNINGTLLFAAGGLVLVLLILIYRSPIFWTIPFFTVLFAETTARGMGYLLAKAGVTINGQSGGILPVLVFGAGTDYALLLVSRYREELRRHDSKHEAIRVALGAAGPAIVASGGTVVLALLVLTLAEVNSTAGLGPVGAMGILVAMGFMLTMLPAALAVFGRRAFWPFVPDGPGGPLAPHATRARRAAWSVLVAALFGAAASSLGPGALAVALAGGLLNFFVFAPLMHRVDVRVLYPQIERPLAARHRLSDETHGVWRRVGERVAASPGKVATATIVLLLALSGGLGWLDTGLTNGNSFRGEVEAVKGQKLLEASFPAGANVPLNVIVPDRARARAVADALRPDVAQVGAPVVGSPGALFTVALKLDPYSTEAFDSIPGLRAKAKRAGGKNVLIGGPTAEPYDYRKAAARDNVVILPIALFVVFAVLAVLLRALLAPALLVATVILSFAAALGVGMFFSVNVFGFPGIDPSLPLLTFVFLVALGIDYNIFLMARVLEEPLLHGTHEGMLRGLAVTGAVITSAGIVLAGTFISLAVLPLIFLTEVGFVIAFGVLLDTFLVRSVLVPALTFETGRRIWWPSKLARVRGH